MTKYIQHNLKLYKSSIFDRRSIQCYEESAIYTYCFILVVLLRKRATGSASPGRTNGLERSIGIHEKGLDRNFGSYLVYLFSAR